MMERLRAAFGRVPTWAWALAFSLALCLPRLGASGFWDPSELRLAEQARDVANSAHLFDPTVAGKYAARPPLDLSLVALGIRVIGPTETGARLFFALSAVLALMAIYWAGAGLLRKRAGLLAVLALGTTPLFVLEARQLTSDAPLIAGLALVLGAMGRYAWPPDGRRRARDLVLGLVGLVIGLLAGGAMSGVVLPLLALTLALAVGRGLRALPTAAVDDGTASLAEPGIGPDVAAEQTLGASTWRLSARGFVPLALLAVVGLVILAGGLFHIVGGKYNWLVGGVARNGAPAHTFETLVRELGFGLFPWSAVAVFALARPLIRLDADREGAPRTNPRLAFVELYLLLFAAMGYALSSYRDIVLGQARYEALPAIALAIGAFLDEALEGLRPEPVAGLLMATGTMIVARDFYLAPEDLASVHLFEKVHWPTNIAVGELILGIGLLAAMGVYAGLAVRPRALGHVPTPAAPTGGRLRRALVGAVTVFGRYGLQAAVACAIFFAFYLSQAIVPALSTHLSFKPVLESYAKFAKHGEKIGRYRVEGHGSSFYSKENLVDLPSQERVVAFLRDPQRVFALVAASELAPLDSAFKQAHVTYYVVDASSSRFLLLTNQLEPGEREQNPLTKDVWMPPAGASSDAKPPWTWRIPISATFENTIELVGVTFPKEVRRPGRIPLDLYFRVKAKPPGGYKIFVHFDGPAAPRVIGDHDPVGHTFGTSFWLPGEYVHDHYETDVPLMTTPAGTYVVYMGFWPGGEGKRLKITDGPNDGQDRVRLGELEIK
ncbi:MAG TPA: glycosyltransferase family 39 protein [Polyangia bacterium]|jgi:4-amino-4-deoxy-L-arabinose transferase-like glycosyltransferase